jgi:hypothetical protein
MTRGAIVMLLVGAVGLWGTTALAIWNYLRRSRTDRPDSGRS